MALIEIYHVVADYYPVDAEWVGGSNFLEGQTAQFITNTDADGRVWAGVAPGDSSHRCIGIAGDTQSDTTSGTPYSASLIINGTGGTRQSSNRVSDFFNETLASGKMTVYHSGGKFATDLFEADVDALMPGDLLYSSDDGILTGVAGLNLVGIVAAPVQAWDSGVPGVDGLNVQTAVQNGSMSLGNYVTFILSV